MLLTLLLRSILISTLGLMALPAFAQAGKASEPVAETDIGRILVDFSTDELERNWVASAHELNVLNMFKDSPRLLSIPKTSLELSSCADFTCRRRLLRDAKIDLYIEGTINGNTLAYKALVPETEQVLNEGTISVSPNTPPEQVKSAFLHAMKPFTEAGGILDQRTALRRAEKAAAEHGPRVAKEAMGISLAALAFVVLLVILGAVFYFQHGRRALLVIGALWIFFALGPLWLISEELALVKPVANFAMPDPWLLAVIGGIGAGWALWGLGLCILPQLCGLETLKQNRMPQVVDALMTVFVYRAIATLVWVGIAAGLVLGARHIFGLDRVHTVALGLMVFGGLGTLSALIFEIIAQALDRKYIIGDPTINNSWHKRVVEAVAAHPLLAELDDLSGSAVFLPTFELRSLAYGGGLSRPRILIPVTALEKAFDTRPEDNGIAYDFLAGLVLDGLGRISLRTHLESTLRLGQEMKSPTPGKIRGFIFGPYRRSRQLLEGCFVAVHDGLGPFIQYLYWRHSPKSENLTVSASSRQTLAITRRILGRIQDGTVPKSIENPRDHICWLVQNFIYPGPDEDPAAKAKGRFRARPRTAAVAVLLTSFFGYQLIAAVRYHSVYEERIAAQQARIDEKKKKKEQAKEGTAHVEEKAPEVSQLGESPALVPVPVPDRTVRDTRSVGRGKATKVVAKAAEKKQRKHKAKPTSRKKTKRQH